MPRKTDEEPLKIFKQAMENVAPGVEVKSRRIGGATYQVPIEVTRDRRNTFGDSLDRYQRPQTRRKNDDRQTSWGITRRGE